MRIKKEEAIAVTIDVQERLMPHILKYKRIRKNIITLVNGLKMLDVPILVTEQYTKGLGPTIQPVRTALGDYESIEKLHFSCQGEIAFSDALAKSGRKTVILFGIETHVCVLQTALDLLEQKYQVVIVQDCVSSRKMNDRTVALNRMQAAGATLTTYESLLFELCVVAGSDTFKSISKLVK